MSGCKLCRNCVHFLKIPMVDDSRCHFCDNPETKKGPNPIGFLDHDAPACALFTSRRRRAKTPAPPIVILPTVDKEKNKDPISLMEHKLARILLLTATAIGLASWIYSDVGENVIKAFRAIFRL